MSKISIKKIEIEIDKKIISLTLDQAKELKRILNDTFAEPAYHGYPIVTPPWDKPHEPFYYDQWKIKSCGGTQTILCSDNSN